ncbi:hypothetical protein BJ138DRAFT_1115468 [Hygrophoropsis aurantiaca]|uniref:Uncharacterized protein n=1 Tax=Hygrophoropsis aurantiaca TaxID=72124 RepID=A0ACB8A647_9AGAM|nr:hypothetical protein BJ138DRAFT_1115468 [Hygrophoropsis aurantiaca]
MDEEYLGQCARIVSASRTAPVSDLKISWQGERARESSGGPVNLFQPGADHVAGDSAYVPIQQAPSAIPSFFPSTRFQVFAIVPRTPGLEQQQEIKITGFVRAVNVPVEVVVPVQDALYPLEMRTAFIHAAAAKALITELEDQDLHPTTPTSGSDLETTQSRNRSNIVRLGTHYGLSSRYTSFISVDDARRLPIGMANSSQALASSKITAPRRYKLVQQQQSHLRFIDTRDDGLVWVEEEETATPPLADTKADTLVALARLQRFDGSFASNSASVIKLLTKLVIGGPRARGLFKRHGLANAGRSEVAAVPLAWAWMSLLWCRGGGYEGKGGFMASRVYELPLRVGKNRCGRYPARTS